MASPRLFSAKVSDGGVLQAIRREFLTGLVLTINSHVMGTDLLDKDEIEAINNQFKEMNDAERAYIRTQINTHLANWKVEDPTVSGEIYYCAMRVIGGCFLGAIAAEVIVPLIDSLPAGLVAGTVIALALAGRELLAFQEPLNRNSRMYDFINSLESCGIEVPVLPSWLEVVRQLAKQQALQQEPQQQPAPRFA